MLGQRLKQARIEAGLSQRQLCGEEITRNMLSQIESGKAKPSMDTLTYLAQKLSKPVSWFLEEGTVASANAETMASARDHYQKGQYSLCMACLEAYQEKDPLFDREKHLLYALSAMEEARQAIAEERYIYARTMLEKAAQAGAQTAYFTPALQRERLLMLYQTQPESFSDLAKQLPGDDRELLLRAQSCLELGEYGESVRLLTAVGQKDGLYHYLMGRALLGQKEYNQAVEHLLLGEKTHPQRCAQALETCYRELEDYKMAYLYACKQRRQGSE